MAESHDLGDFEIPSDASKQEKIDALLKGMREKLTSENTDLLAENDAFKLNFKKQGP